MRILPARWRLLSTAETSVWDDDDIIAFSKATGRDLKLFFEDGWAGNDLELDMAISLMTYALHVFTGSFSGGQTEWDEELKGP